MIVVVTRDPSLIARVERAARAASREVSAHPTIEAALPGAEPSAVLVDLDVPGATEQAAGLRARWPGALLAASIAVPDRARWDAAIEAGYDLVATRGTVAAQMLERLATWTGPSTRNRFRLFEHADVVGRLGLVFTAADTPVGPVAVYHLGNTLYAVQSVCPHAGADLSRGALEGTTLTCPLHGSQFDVRSGERVRGPSDREIASYDLVIEGGIVSLEYD